MKFSTVAAVALCLCLFAGIACGKSGIKGIYVFGDSLSDTGNASMYQPVVRPEPGETYPLYPRPYLPGRASNGPVWVEILASAYGYSVDPALAGGRNFAFAGAETGSGFSDQGTLNFHAQIRLFKSQLEKKEIKKVHPKDLFVVWVGVNDFMRIQASGRSVTREDIQTATSNIGKGILELHEQGARMFLVPDMLAINLTPDYLEKDEAAQLEAKRLVNAFNKSLEGVLKRLEQNPKISILRMNAYRIYVSIFDNGWLYGFDNVTEAALDTTPTNPESPWGDYLSWDGFHPTATGHAVLAQFAMNTIPIGSWWGHSVSRGPDETAILGMGWVSDKHWPWIYSYSYKEGQWMWVYEEAGNPEGFLAYVPQGYKWIWVNAQSGWYFDYGTSRWKRIEE